MTTNTPSEITLQESVDRLNRTHSDKLKDCEFILHTIAGQDLYQLYIEPKEPDKHETHFRSKFGDAHPKDEMKAFIFGLDLADEITTKSEYQSEKS